MRVFFTQNPWKPLGSEGDAYTLDLPLDAHVAPLLIHLTRVAAAAGVHGL